MAERHPAIGPAPRGLRAGMKVTSDFHAGEGDVVRTLTALERSSVYGSGWYASADGGEPCPHCQRPMGQPISAVDAHWFEPVEPAKPAKRGRKP